MLQCISWNLHYYVEFFISFRSAKCQNLVSVNNTYVLGIVPTKIQNSAIFRSDASKKLKKINMQFSTEEDEASADDMDLL